MHFDPSRHMVIATSPRPTGATGDGEIKRVGLVQNHSGKARVIRPASVVLYDDVKIQFEEGR
jgi:molecular chaperone GrpE (heat shock protein)